MNKLKYILVAFTAFALLSELSAQDVEKEFEAFQKQQQADFEDFKNKADAEFETFLRETWEKYNAFTPVPAPTRPEPPMPTEFDKTKPALKPVVIKPAAPKVPETVVPDGKYIPIQVEIPVVKPGKTVHRTSIDFYGTSFEVATFAIEDLALKGKREPDVADAWKGLCQQDYELLISDCVTLKKEKQLNDWAYVLFTKQIGTQLYGPDCPDDVAFLQMFILNKSGYKVRLAKIDEQLKLMIAPANTIYGAPYLTMNGSKYYVFEPTSGSSMSIYTYSQDFANAKNLVALDIDALPALAMKEEKRMFTSSTGDVKVQTAVNKNLINLYDAYPQCDVDIHYRAPMSEELRSSLYPQLKVAIAGKSEKDAANILINWVQTAFEYQTDGEQFGYEKPNFLDETFYYPYCDCEDRAMLYSTLIKDLLGLDAILLDYPEHIASAVKFTEDISGDYVVLDDGSRYLICDPTYIGAPIGTCMEQYREVAPGIIR